MLFVGMIPSVATEDGDDVIAWVVALNALSLADDVVVNTLEDVVMLDDIITLDDVPSVTGILVEVDWLTGAIINIYSYHNGYVITSM